MRNTIYSGLAALALGAAGCMEMEDTDTARYALNERVETEIVSMELAGYERISPNVQPDRVVATAKYEFFLPLDQDAVPEPRPEITNADVEYYTVEGETCEEVKEDIFNPRTGKGFLEDGTRYGGDTDMELGYDCGVDAQPQPHEDRKEYCCKAMLENVEGYCNATVHLPQWDGSDECWDRFIDALKTHEQGHVDMCHDYAQTLETALPGLESTVCSEESMEKACNDAMADLGQKADAAEERVHQRHNEAQDAYDAETSHGETQGAVLNCDCE